MCLILFGYRTSAELPLIVAANRDENYFRDSSIAQFWSDYPDVLAGRDLVAGGTWLGCTKSGRFAALTNFSEPADPVAPKSRGLLVQNFLIGDETAQRYAHHIEGPQYAGFNLLLFDGEEMVYTSNKSTTEVLTPGFYGLSNAQLGAQWPKCLRGAAGLQQLAEDAYELKDLVALLHNTEVAGDEELPRRGRPLEVERRLAPCFIVGEEYGTRASTALILTNTDLRFAEQSYVSGGGATDWVEFSFALPDKSNRIC